MPYNDCAYILRKINYGGGDLPIIWGFFAGFESDWSGKP